MALLWCDSYDHWTSGGYASKWDNVGFDFFGQPGITGGRFGNGFACGADLHLFRKTLTSHDTWIVGTAVLLALAGTQGVILRLDDAGTTQVSLRLDGTGKLTARRGGTSLGVGTAVLSTGVWYYVEMKAVIHNTAGSVEVRVNGAVDINLTSQDTQATANATADGVGWGQTGGLNAGVVVFDDFYACDGTGAAPTNTFLGDVRVDALLPSGNGNSSLLVGSDANSVDNYLLVDEATPNDDTDYVESNVVTDEDTYTYGNLSTTAGTVFGLQVLPYIRKTSAGVRSAKTVARLAGVEVDGPEQFLPTNYVYASDIREAKPGGGVWTIADVNAAEFGIKVFS